MAKKLAVTIKMEMEVPDHWELATTSDGVTVLKTGDQEFMDLAIQPLFTNDMDGLWRSSDDDDTDNEIMGMVESEDITYEFSTTKPH